MKKIIILLPVYNDWESLNKVLNEINKRNYFINNMDINPYGGDAWKGPGFHGDIRLINIVDNCIKNCTSFIETGTNRG